jgi:hypothetical protein
LRTSDIDREASQTGWDSNNGQLGAAMLIQPSSNNRSAKQQASNGARASEHCFSMTIEDEDSFSVAHAVAEDFIGYYVIKATFWASHEEAQVENQFKGFNCSWPRIITE